jgi:hypothetical protein
MKKLIIYALIGFGAMLFVPAGVQSQQIGGEDDCDMEIFTGTVTYADGVPDPFEWECHGDFTNCTEVYIICPAGLES